LETDGEKEIICSPLNGMAVNCEGIKDLTFRGEMLGKTVAIRPTDGKVYAPADGKVDMLMETLHAVNMTSEKGAEILIHVGLDTVSLNGEPFTIHVEADQKVKKGDLIAEFDMDAIKAAGLETITPVIICNSDDYKEIKRFTGKQVKPGDDIMELIKA
jgi:PTS system beta-glucosides-specific IIC component